jgi:NTP pyrophosphatase (non-canonical NTP hydrolase)
MTPTEYVELAMRTSAKHASPEDRFENACLGLIGKLGEVAEHYKKHRFHGKPLDREKVLEEIGDLYWYGAQMCDAAGMEPETVFLWGPMQYGCGDYEESSSESHILKFATRCLGDVFYLGMEGRFSTKDHLHSMFCCTKWLIQKLGSTQEAVMEANIAKLKARWPDGFKVPPATAENTEDDGA